MESFVKHCFQQACSDKIFSNKNVNPISHTAVVLFLKIVVTYRNVESFFNDIFSFMVTWPKVHMVNWPCAFLYSFNKMKNLFVYFYHMIGNELIMHWTWEFHGIIFWKRNMINFFAIPYYTYDNVRFQVERRSRLIQTRLHQELRNYAMAWIWTTSMQWVSFYWVTPCE